jgi:hypothetical protein
MIFRRRHRFSLSEVLDLIARGLMKGAWRFEVLPGTTE